jgi:hypothetical protein
MYLKLRTKDMSNKDEFDVIWDQLWNESVADDELNRQIEAKTKVFRNVLVDAMKETQQNVSYPKKNRINVLSWTKNLQWLKNLLLCFKNLLFFFIKKINKVMRLSRQNLPETAMILLNNKTTTLITLNFVGNFDNGFKVTLREEGKDWQSHFKLNSDPELKEEFEKWQQHNLNSLRIARGEYIEPEEVIRYNEFSQDDFIQNFKSWLTTLSLKIRERINDQDKEVGVVIQSDDDVIIRLPWHELEEDLFKDKNCFGNSTITLGRLHNFPKKKEGKYSKIKMLAVFGGSKGIDTNFDKQILENLKSKDLELTSLINPTKQELKDAIADRQGWHIFFFAGHSSDGSFKINKDENIDINDFKYCIYKAIHQGLRLMILNSGDVLKLAQQLENLPQTIVMRQNIPDKAAQKFLKVFINNFVGRGKSLYSSMLEARNELGKFEQQFPGIKSSPIIYQISNEHPLSWRDIKISENISFFNYIKNKFFHN